MLHIKKFMDRMSAADSRQTKDLVLPMLEARGLRDDIIKLLTDLNELYTKKSKEYDDLVVDVEISGGKF